MSRHEYVLCFAEPLEHAWWPEVLLVEKRKPAWQAGKWNLPGGSIERGETPIEAARRELWEEAAIDCELANVAKLGSLAGEDYVVHVMHCGFESLRGLNRSKSVTSERVFWLPVREALHAPQLIDNLRIVIPFAKSRFRGWTIEGDCGLGIHTVFTHQCESNSP